MASIGKLLIFSILLVVGLAPPAPAAFKNDQPGPQGAARINDQPGPQGAAKADALNSVSPWAGALSPESASGQVNRPAVPHPTLQCKEGLKNFPFLKPWVAKLDNFVVPFEVGSNDGSLFYAIGATAVNKGASEAWKNDAVALPIEWGGRSGTLESSLLGPQPEKDAEPAIKQGPGDAYTMMLAARLGNPAKAGRWSRFWSLLFSPAELRLLEECTIASCKIKFSDQELKSVVGSVGQYRLPQLLAVIDGRLEDFRKQSYVRAYEGTSLPLDWMDLRFNTAFPTSIATHFWTPQDRAQFGYDYLDAAPGSYKPVLDLFSRSCEKRGTGEGSYTVCADIVLYNNHYFDFWARVVLFVPWCESEVALAYETADVDQVKSSRLVRVLFGGEMRDLVGHILETRLKRLHVLSLGHR